MSVDEISKVRGIASERQPRACMLAYTFYENDGRVIRYAESLVKQGYQVDAIVLGREGSLREERINGVRVSRIQKRRKDEKGKFSYLFKILGYFFRSMLEVTRRQFNRRYDVIHVHSVPDFEVFASVVPKLMGAKIILDIHDIVPELYSAKFNIDERAWSRKGLELIERVSARYADHVIIANDLWRDRIVSRSVPVEKCTSFLNFPDTSIFHSGLRTRTEDGLFRIVYPGTLNWHQGVDIAIKGFKIAKDKMPGCELLIYGEGPAKGDLEALIRELGLVDSVSIEAPMPIRRIAAIMANADLGVVPKRDDSFGGEAFSTKILEFMSVSVPLVVSDTKVDRYYFDETVVRFFKAGDANELAGALVDAFQNRKSNAVRVANARKHVEEMTWDQKQNEYLSLVRRLVAEK